MNKLRNTLKYGLILILFIALLPFNIFGQDEKMAEVTSTFAITNVNIIQAPGRKIEMGTVIVENGIITAVGKSIAIPTNAKIIKADSMYLYAGFIDGLSQVGVQKPKDDENEDVKDPGNPPNDIAGIQPDRDVRSFLDPNDKSISDLRQLGFTAAHVVPHGRMLPGSGSIILLSGNTPDAMIYRSRVTLFSQLQGAPGIYPNTVIGVMAKYRDLYRNARNTKSYTDRYNQDGVNMTRPTNDRVLEAFYPVIDKQIPVVFKAENVLDIQRVFTLKNDLGFDLILGGVKQGWDVADKIKSTNTKVFLSLDLPELEKKEEEKDSVNADSVKIKEKEVTPFTQEQEQLEKRKEEMILKYYEQPSLYTNKGIVYGFSTIDAKSKDVKTNLFNLVDKGLSEEAALTALTTAPAQLLGLSKTMGTVDKGKVANMVITDNPYFEEKSNVKMVFVDGKLYEYADKPKKKKSDGEAANVTGSWAYTTETPQGTGTGTLNIEGQLGDLGGDITISFTGETNTLTEVGVDGNELSFAFTINVGGNSMDITVLVTIDGDTFEGTMTAGQFGSFPIEGERKPDN